MRRKVYRDLLPDVSPLAVVGFVIIPFFMFCSTQPRSLGDFSDMHVRLPDAVAYETCVLMDEPIHVVYLDKNQRLYVLSTDKYRQEHLVLMPSVLTFRYTIDSLVSHSDYLNRPRFVIRADKDTKMSVIQQLFDCFLANGIQKFALTVDANSPKYEDYRKFREAQSVRQK